MKLRNIVNNSITGLYLLSVASAGIVAVSKFNEFVDGNMGKVVQWAAQNEAIGRFGNYINYIYYNGARNIIHRRNLESQIGFFYKESEEKAKKGILNLDDIPNFDMG